MLSRWNKNHLNFEVEKLILDSWASGTRKQYKIYFKQWTTFCKTQTVDISNVSVKDGTKFLLSLYKKELGYSASNTARSMLSNILPVKEGIEFAKPGADPGGEPTGLVPPKVEHLNVWWQPSFYPAFYFTFVIVYIYFLISLFSISFFNYNWKMTILIVCLSLIYICSIMLIFSHLFWSLYWAECFYLFRSSHWEIFYKIATSVLH